MSMRSSASATFPRKMGDEAQDGAPEERLGESRVLKRNFLENEQTKRPPRRSGLARTRRWCVRATAGSRRSVRSGTSSSVTCAGNCVRNTVHMSPARARTEKTAPAGQAQAPRSPRRSSETRPMNPCGVPSVSSPGRGQEKATTSDIDTRHRAKFCQPALYGAGQEPKRLRDPRPRRLARRKFHVMQKSRLIGDRIVQQVPFLVDRNDLSGIEASFPSSLLGPRIGSWLQNHSCHLRFP